MEIRKFAEHVLFGESLAEKLATPSEFTDEKPGNAIATPKFPHRPKAWSRTPHASGHPNVDRPFPAISKMSCPQIRGEMLHAFANHELLAMEIMALTLLRFPDAPKQFRQTVAKTLTEEQTHFQLYLDRIQALGAETDGLPLGSFFWDSAISMQDPMDYVIRISLTFEQANLDHAIRYARLFTAVDDHESAKVMKQILDDEIVHVRRGLQWFRLWRPEHETEWETFTRLLPLTPTRARGRRVHRKPRELAGLTPSFIDEITVAGQSRGRPPNVWWFHPTVEAELANGAEPFQAPQAIADLAQDLSTLPLFLASRGDLVLTADKPSIPFLTALQEAGVQLPEVVKSPTWPVPPSPFPSRQIGDVRPWGWSAQVLEVVESLAPQATTKERFTWSPALRHFSSKAWWVPHTNEMMERLRVEWDPDDRWLLPRAWDPTVVVNTDEALHDVAQAYSKVGAKGVVLKAPFTTSGQGQRRIEFPANPSGEQLSDAFPEEALRWATRIVQEQGGLVVEPWLNRQFDLSFHFDIRHASAQEQPYEVVHVGNCHFMTSDRGRFKGVVLGRFPGTLPESTVTLLQRNQPGKGPRLNGIIRWLGEQLLTPLAEAGWRGPIGVDAMVFTDSTDQTLRLRPVVEINPRFTMGRLGLALRRHLMQGAVGTWSLHRTQDPVGLAEQLTANAPLLTDAVGDVERRWRSGVLPTNDPSTARRWLSVVSVGPDLETCHRQLSLG